MKLIILTFSILVTASASSSRSGYSIAVYGIEGIGINRELALTLQEQLESNLTGYKRFRVVSRNDMDKVLAETRIQQSGICPDENCMVRAGSILGVDEIITGTVSRIGHTYNIVLKEILVESGTIKASVNKQYTGTVDSLLQITGSALCELITDDFEIIPPEPRIIRDTIFSTDTVVVTKKSTDTIVVLKDKIPEDTNKSAEGKEVKLVKNENDGSGTTGKALGRKIGTGALVVFGSLGLIFLAGSLK